MCNWKLHLDTFTMGSELFTNSEDVQFIHANYDVLTEAVIFTNSLSSVYLLCNRISFNKLVSAMIVSNSNVNYVNGLSEKQLLALVNHATSSLVARLAQNPDSLPDVLSLTLSTEEEKLLLASLQCSVATLRQVVPCVGALILKCGVLGPGETLASCGVARLPSDALMKAYSSHRPLIDPLLAPLQSPAAVMQELRGVAHELSVESCTSTRSRTCAPLALLQLTAAVPPHLPASAQAKPAVGCAAPQKILLQFYEDELYEFHMKLEEIQKKLDSFL